MQVSFTLQGTPGLTFGKAEDKLGWNAQPTCAIMLDDVRIPAADLLGEEGKGFSIAMNACNVAVPHDKHRKMRYAMHASMYAQLMQNRLASVF